MIDLDALPAAVRSRVEFAIKSAMHDHTRDAEMLTLCQTGTDAELIAACEAEYPGAPIGLSTWYSRVGTYQETIFNRVAHWAGRRPVFMRGARQIRIASHCLSSSGFSANGWAIAVFWRAVRMMRETQLDWYSWHLTEGHIIRKLSERYRLTRSFFDAVQTTRQMWNWQDYHARIIGGRRVFLTDDQLRHIEALNAIARKADTLEQRRELVRRNMMERLAA